MTGINKLCKLYSRTNLQGIEWVWDYANDKAVKESDMAEGSEAWKESERAKYSKFITH